MEIFLMITEFMQKARTLLKIFENESEMAIDWFKENKMIVNSTKLQAMIMNVSKKVDALYSLTMNNYIIKSTD